MAASIEFLAAPNGQVVMEPGWPNKLEHTYQVEWTTGQSRPCDAAATKYNPKSIPNPDGEAGIPTLDYDLDTLP